MRSGIDDWAFVKCFKSKISLTSVAHAHYNRTCWIVSIFGDKNKIILTLLNPHWGSPTVKFNGVKLRGGDRNGTSILRKV